MAGLRIHVVMDVELVERIDAVVGGGSRGEFVRRAVERALSEAKGPGSTMQADPGSVSSSEGVRSAAPAEQLGDVEQTSVTGVGGGSPGVSKADLPASAEQPEMGEVERRGFENLTGVRSSGQAKRGVGPVPKGER